MLSLNFNFGFVMANACLTKNILQPLTGNAFALQHFLSVFACPVPSLVYFDMCIGLSQECFLLYPYFCFIYKTIARVISGLEERDSETTGTGLQILRNLED